MINPRKIAESLHHVKIKIGSEESGNSNIVIANFQRNGFIDTIDNEIVDISESAPIPSTAFFRIESVFRKIFDNLIQGDIIRI
ncbi:hypothetical protein SDC9_211958 [bioreactor metagenome]|uniref:Uncharacterized protein n=1 Tax=bioreactor metagenome TaxID=1076179 RepID=A0A645JLF4_9ZZZZ